MLSPNKYNDWIKKRDESFEKFIAMGEKNSEHSIFELFLTVLQLVGTHGVTIFLQASWSRI